MTYMSLVGGKELNEQKNKSHFFEWERTRVRQEEDLGKRQRYIKFCIYSFNKYLLSLRLADVRGRP